MRHIPVAFLHARLAAVFVLSLSAVAWLSAATRPKVLSGPFGMVWPPLLLAAATFGGLLLYDRLSLFAERAGRRRFRPVGWTVYGILAFVTLSGTAAGKKEALLAGATLFALVHPLFLLFAGLGRGYIGALTNAFAMACCAAVVGGPAAAGAVASYAGLLVFFLGVDHPARKLTEYPVDEIPAAGPAIGRAAAAGAAVAAGLALFFVAVPPRPFEAIRVALELQPLPPADLGGLLLQLGVVGALAAVAMYFAIKLSVGLRDSQKELVFDRVGARRRSDPKTMVRRREGGEAAAGWRARIVRLYVRVLEQLGKAGFRRRPDETPSETARRLEPRPEAEALAGIFVRARFGPEDPTEEEFREAARAGQAVVDGRRGEPGGGPVV